MKLTPANIIMMIITIVTALATTLSPAVQSFWSDHPEAGPLVLLGYKTLALFLPSPITAKNPGA